MTDSIVLKGNVKDTERQQERKRSIKEEAGKLAKEAIGNDEGNRTLFL